MSIAILRGDARSLPLPDGCADLVLCSPPYFSLRDYRDGGQSLDGQIGAEAGPHEYVDALLECTAEWMRVLKPSGSMFIVLGDKYANDAKWGGATSGKHVAGLHGKTGIGRAKMQTGMPAKSLMDLPMRYSIRCADELGLIKRATIIWSKASGLPESVQDRIRVSHEYVLHFTKQPRYYSATDEIREPHQGQRHAPGNKADGVTAAQIRGQAQASKGISGHLAEPDREWGNPLGKLPGSVWEVENEVWLIASQPLNVPDRIEHARCCNGRKRPGCADGLSHHAAYPFDLIRPVILGWSPSAICLSCGEGRRPVTDVERVQLRQRDLPMRARLNGDRIHGPDQRAGTHARNRSAIIGYACACTPYTDHPGSGKRDLEIPDRWKGGPVGGGGFASQARDAVRTGPWREYHLEGWTPPPTRPALVVDPFSGTGTTLLTADALGRNAVGIDRSHDYCRLAQWRTTDPGERARARQIPKPPVVPPGQDSLFTLEAS